MADASTRRTTADPDVVYALDWVVSSSGYVSASGWLVHHQTPVVSVALVLETHEGRQYIPGDYGRRRSDIPTTCRGQGQCGFVIFGSASNARPERIVLRANLASGDTCDVEIEVTAAADTTGHPPKLLRAISAPGWRARLTQRLWWSRVLLAHAASGGLRHLLRVRGRHAGRLRAARTPLPALEISALLDALRADRSPRPSLMIDNDLGGGTTLYREQWIRRRTGAGGVVVLLYYDFHGMRYVLRYVTATRDESFATDALDVLLLLATAVEFDGIVLNHVCSFPDPSLLARLLPVLTQVTGAPLTVAVHDYFSVCPSLNLLDDGGRFCGVPQIERCRQCLPNIRGETRRLTPWEDIDAWRAAWAPCLEAATTVLCFSHASQALLERAYPHLDGEKFRVQPHAVDYLPARAVTVNVEQPLHIGVVGEITTAKGAGIIGEMAQLIETQRLAAQITVIGTLQRGRETPVLRILGPYRREDLPQLIERCGANVFFLPSIWAETFSYVAEELMQLGVPVAVFDLGAPAERVARYPRGLLIDRIDAAHALQRLIAFHAELRTR